MRAPFGSRAPGAAATVLVAEDEALIRRLVVTVLEAEGFRVLAAADGPEALAAADRHPGPIALLVSNVCLPRLDGVELARALQARRPGLKVLLVSGYPAADGFEEVLAPGAVHFLPKPFVPAGLVRGARELLGLPAAP